MESKPAASHCFRILYGLEWIIPHLQLLMREGNPIYQYELEVVMTAEEGIQLCIPGCSVTHPSE